MAGFGFVPSPQSCLALLLRLLKSSRNPCLCKSIFLSRGTGWLRGHRNRAEAALLGRRWLTGAVMNCGPITKPGVYPHQGTLIYRSVLVAGYLVKEPEIGPLLTCGTKGP